MAQELSRKKEQAHFTKTLSQVSSSAAKRRSNAFKKIWKDNSDLIQQHRQQEEIQKEHTKEIEALHGLSC